MNWLYTDRTRPYLCYDSFLALRAQEHLPYLIQIIL